MHFRCQTNWWSTSSWPYNPLWVFATSTTLLYFWRLLIIVYKSNDIPNMQRVPTGTLKFGNCFFFLSCFPFFMQHFSLSFLIQCTTLRYNYLKTSKIKRWSTSPYDTSVKIQLADVGYVKTNSNVSKKRQIIFCLFCRLFGTQTSPLLSIIFFSFWFCSFYVIDCGWHCCYYCIRRHTNTHCMHLFLLKKTQWENQCLV